MTAIVTHNAGEVAAALGEASVKAGFKARAVIQYHGALLQNKVKSNASGRPGPRAQTGDYRRSITLDVGHGAAGYEARVGSGRPQAARLEFGFTGTDSRGRHYNQPPFPHFGPALKAIEPAFLAACAEIVSLDVGAMPSVERFRDEKGRFA